MEVMTEREACALLKSRFEAAGYRIAENQAFDEQGVTFELDGFDRERRVGYEYVTEEAGDSWDVDGTVIAALDARRKLGELFILIIDEANAPDAAALDRAARAFLVELPGSKAKPAARPAAKPKAKATKPATKTARAKKPSASPKSARAKR
jgi:hypothetical protein